MKTYSLFAVLFVALTLLIPHATHAYFKTGESSFTTDSKTAIYALEFTFGHKDHEILMPVIAKNTTEKSNTELAYEIRDDKGELAKGTTLGIILSDAKIKDGMYVIPKGKSMKFTLLTFYTKGADETDTAFRTQVTSLPFNFDGKQQLQLNPSELKYYTTKLIGLGTGIGVTAVNVTTK